VTDYSILGVSIIAITILAAIVLPGIRRGTGTRDKGGGLQKLRRSGHYWGVRIQPGNCAAIRHFAGRRFTFEEAPNLPLPGCKAWRCSCTYVGLPERRREERRTRKDRRDAVRVDDEHAERRSIRERRRQHKDWQDPAD
jgi:hypothetical protein